MTSSEDDEIYARAPSVTYTSDPDSEVDGSVQPTSSAFVPVLLIAIALVTWLAFQTTQLVREQQQLELMKASLLPQEQAATKLRTSLDEVATSTAKLAAGGNANARAIVEQLQSRGVTINPAGPAKPQ